MIVLVHEHESGNTYSYILDTNKPTMGFSWEMYKKWLDKEEDFSGAITYFLKDEQYKKDTGSSNVPFPSAAFEEVPFPTPPVEMAMSVYGEEE